MAVGLGQTEVLPFRATVFNTKNNSMEFFDADHKDEFHRFITDSELRTLALAGDAPPSGFMSAKAWAVVLEYYGLVANGYN